MSGLKKKIQAKITLCVLRFPLVCFLPLYFSLVTRQDFLNFTTVNKHRGSKVWCAFYSH